MLRSVNPYNQEVIAEFQENDLDTIDRMLTFGQQGFTSWRQTRIDGRADFMRALAATLRENVDEYAGLITREMGKVIKESRKEVEKSAMALEYFAEHGEGYLQEQKTRAGKGEGLVRYEPMGVVLGIMPWNYPFWQFFRFASTTLMAGNVILLKHSSQVPACAQKIEEIFQKACLPDGVFQNLMISSSFMHHVIKDFRVQAVSLTGGLQAGSQVAEHAGKHIKKSVLELGGSDPFIVLEDADVQEAARAGVKSRMKNFGQSCDAAKRFILHERIAEEFIDAFQKQMESLKFGDPMDEDTDYGSLSSESQKELLNRQMKNTLDKGASVIWKGQQADEESGAFFNPVILKDVPADTPAYSEEVFGPVAPVFVVSDGLQAVRLANDTDYGLGASIWTSDYERGLKLASEVQAGLIHINQEVHSMPQLPFGGVKQSGLGREMAAEGSREFTNEKSLWYQIGK